MLRSATLAIGTALLIILIWRLGPQEILAALSRIGSYAALIEGSTKFIGLAFAFVPLQVGVAEGAYALIFEAIGLPPPAGFTLAFARRIRTIAVASVGLPTLARLMRDRGHRR